MTPAPKAEPSGNFLLYDGECPVCSQYVAWTSLRTIRPDIELLNARNEPRLVANLRVKGIEINDAFCLSIDGHLIHGAEAMTMVGRIAEPKGLFNQIIFWLLRQKWIVSPAYPILVRARKLLLAILGRGLIP
jgi:predicted DCC family thiol-disulfide oxidoreductase YuxK